MKKIVILLFLLTALTASAQKLSISGQLIDSLHTPLPAATVMILNPVDSALVNFVVADHSGHFYFKNLAAQDYLLKVTFLGYRPYSLLIAAKEGVDAVDVGKIEMQPAASELDAVEIIAQRAPVRIKKDTIEFDAASFKTKENAMVEDLLKKLPGIEVDNEGNVTAQGEQVRHVTIDGKKFFGNDPKLATRNLPADAVKNVQVFDKQSDQATFTGIEDGQREKTINLELRPEKRDGTFGNIMAGAGTSDRLEARASINKFGKGQQLSFLGMGNNVNQSGFGIEEYMNFTGGSRQMMRGGGVRIQANQDNGTGVPVNFGNRANGLLSTYAGGVNVNNDLGSNTEINGSYFYNYLNHDRDQTTIRENFLPDGNFTFTEDNLENNTNSNHKVNATLDHKIDSANILRFTTNLTLNNTDSEQRSTSANMTPDGSVASRNERAYYSNGLQQAFNSNLLYRHRFPKKGRSISASLALQFNRNETSGVLDAVNTFYNGETQSQQDILEQSNDHVTDFRGAGATVSYTEPLGKNTFLEMNYNLRQNRSNVTRDVYNNSNGESTYDEALSSRYKSDYQYQRAGLNFRIAGDDYNVVAGASLQQTNLKGEQEIANSAIDRTFTNVLPSMRLHYNFSDTKHLRFDYESTVTEPDIRQLQPVVDNSNPLNIYIGNPQLRPSYSQSWRLNYRAFSPVNFISFFALADIDYTSNAIINSQHIDERFVRTITPVNVSSNLRLNTRADLGIPVKKLSSRLNVSGFFRNVNSIALVNDQQNDIVQQTAGGTLRYTYTYKDIFDLSLSASLDHQETRYEFNQPDQTFINGTYAAESNVSFLKHYAFNLNFDYLVYENASQDFNQHIPLLNLSFSRFLLKNKSGELKIGVNNLLDKALGIDQTASINYLERVTTNSLGRYFMLSFTYSLNKQLNPMDAPKRRPMMRIKR